VTHRMRWALLVGAGTGLATLALVNVLLMRSSTGTVDIWTVRRAVTAGEPLSRAELVPMAWPRAVPLAGLLSPSTLPAAAVATTDLVPGVPLLRREVGAPSVGPQSSTLPPHDVSIPLQLSPANAGVPVPQSGSVVGIMGSPSPGGAVMVLAIGAVVQSARTTPSASGGPMLSLQLALPLRAALTVEQAAHSGGVWLFRAGKDLLP
jgi:hypothetical protein